MVPLNPWLDLDVYWQESPRHSAVLQLFIPSHPDGRFQGCLFSSRLFKETLLRMRDEIFPIFGGLSHPLFFFFYSFGKQQWGAGGGG